MEPAIKINNLSVTLGGRVKALKSVDLELPAGHIIGFIGPSGAGKTTLMRVIVGRQKPDAGEVLVLSEPAGSKKLRGKIGYMPQSASVYNDLTVIENLRYFATISRADEQGLRRILEEVNMTKYAGRLITELSGGQRSRVSLAIALIGQPPLLVLDEPTVGVDPVLRKQLWELFKRLAGRGSTIIVSSHVMDEAEHCDTLALIRGGRVLALGAPEELCRRNKVDDVEEVFLKLVKREKV